MLAAPPVVFADAGLPDGEADGCPTGATGTLFVEIAGTSEPDELDVRIDGIDERVNERAKATTHLRLPTGRYQISAETVTSPVEQGRDEPFVRRVFVPSVATPQVCVRDTKTVAAKISYASMPTDGALFVAHANAKGQVARLDHPSKALLKSTVDTFDVQVSAARGLAFDRGGDLWLAGDGAVARVPGRNLAGSGTGPGAPDRRISGALFTGSARPTALAFDSDGDLWVSLPGAKEIVELPAWSLAASGEPRPTVVIDGAAFADLPALAFDRHGNLFVASGEHVLRYDGARLASSTDAVADLDVTVGSPPDAVRDLAFDTAGNLWLVRASSSVIVSLERADLEGTGSRAVAPEVQITLASPDAPDAIAFDEAGGIWLGQGPAKLGRLSREQLAASATVTPDHVIEGIRLGSASRLAFFPGPKGSLLHSALP